MTRAAHVISAPTMARLANIRKLVTELQHRQLMREDIADLLCLSPSGVRKYVKDLAGVIGVARYVDSTSTFIGFPVYQLAIGADQVGVFLEQLAIGAPTRAHPARQPSLSRASKDPRRHFHILADDAHYAIRVNRAPVARDWAVSALFGAGPARGEARA